jgi:hypothetical protein
LWEKRDGTLCTLYHYDEEWCVSTRGRADAGGSVNGSSTKTFRDLFFETLKSYGGIPNGLLTDYCYVFELTGPENRVITPYSKNELRLLTVRNIGSQDSLNYCIERPLFEIKDISDLFGISMPIAYEFKNADHINNMLRTINGLEEGFVLCDYRVVFGNFPRVKIKSPRYLAAASLVGNGFDEGKALDVVLHGDVQEFILYFPEYEGVIDNVTGQLTELTSEIEDEFQGIRPLAARSRKEFAEAAKKTKCPGAMFSLLDKKCSTPFEFFKGAKNDEWKELLNDMPKM